jgi:hypothetical protein
MAGWLKKLREDKRELLRCAADTEKTLITLSPIIRNFGDRPRT